MLEHHADLAADLVDLLEVVGELDAVDDDAALLVLLQPVDAADHRRLAGSGRAADHDALAAHDAQIDVAQHVELAVPFVHADEIDGDGVAAALRERLALAVAGRSGFVHCLVLRQRLSACASRFSMFLA